MSLQHELEKRVEKKMEEIDRLEKELNAAKAYLQALNDSIKLFPKYSEAKAGGEKRLREGSDLAKARDFLKKAGEPLHITKILQGIQKEATKANRLSLAGSLGGYARKGVIFTRPEPNTFGLVEFEEQSTEPPDDFGNPPKASSTVK